ncbi:GCN5 family N-acetyltransferase [Embleya hyalina]|uniref:GCN5 family N-acetyltransferase n=2 Tax=Embleya hyalina TaxID=516124 RepID=A0A401Z4P4_9ACTN|nr:GCN5 family N-acetyltransferase [Embleya hyalina]
MWVLVGAWSMASGRRSSRCCRIAGHRPPLRRSGGLGAALIEDVRREATRRAVDLIRVDCYAGGDGALVEQYRTFGFSPLTQFAVERPGHPSWPGRLLGMRLNSRQR